MPMYRRRRYSRKGRSFKRTQISRLARPPKRRSQLAIQVNDPDPLLYQSRKWYANRLTDIPRNGNNDGREHNRIWIRGFRLRIVYQNISTQPVYMNWAIIAKGDLDLEQYFSPTITTPGGAPDFFRNIQTSTSNVEAIDFDQVNNNAQRSGPINTRQYTVIWHLRRCIGPGRAIGTPVEADSPTGYMPSYGRLDRYIKLNFPVSFKDATGTSCNTQFSLVYWFNNTLELGATLPGDTINIQRNICTYFRGGRV